MLIYIENCRNILFYFKFNLALAREAKFFFFKYLHITSQVLYSYFFFFLLNFKNYSYTFENHKRSTQQIKKNIVNWLGL